VRVWRDIAETRHRMRIESAEAQVKIETLAAESERMQTRRSTPMDEGALQFPPPLPEEHVEIPAPIPPPSLVEALLSEECILFAGPGVADSGTPNLLKLLAAITVKAEGRLSGTEDVEEALGFVEDALRGGEYSAAIDFLRRAIGEEAFEGILRDEIPPVGDEAILRVLAELPFSGAITTDWSGRVGQSLLPRGGTAFTPPLVDEAIDSFRDGEFFLLEAAGNIWAPPLWVSFAEMRDLAIAEREYARFVVSMLNTRATLFLGSDVTGIEEFLDCFPSQGIEREHWALVPWQSNIDQSRERFRRRYQVELLPYHPSAGPDGIGQFVRRLQDKVPRRRSSRKTSLRAEQLRGLKLQNIGPFEDLEIELDSPTVLLGDNGSGKSSVLRAIALALAGDSAPPQAARRMLKSTAKRGEIELLTDRDRYRTQLIGDGQRVRIETNGLPPIQANSWLALGFPPLRGVSLSNPRGPTSALADEPVPEDLLPLLSNGPDQRLDGLKQWVVNAAMQANFPATEGLRGDELLDRFFRILRDLTPGMQFEYRGVDPRTWEVNLDSPDGPVSFDLLSRGMTATMGWVGVLLQRLYEVYGDRDGRPEEQPALVLVDEIDVHLHPEWQHLVMPLIGEHFPNVQLIVTTHSPLIVANAADGAVQLLQRVDDVPSVLKLSNEFAGWRSDQILTSAAFGLESTRDAETAAKHREYRNLMAHGETPEVNERARQLYTELEERMPPEAETSAEREGVALFRTWLQSRFADHPVAEQDKIINEAERYLDRLYAERKK